MLKLAFRNITSKPWRFVATIVAIAVVVAMSFCMLSFRDAVYDYIFATETADTGHSDITIAINSSSSRITEVAEPLKSLDGIKTIVPVFKLYALCEDEYVEVRGFEKGQLEVLQSISLAKGEISGRVDDVIISENCAQHFGVDVGDKIELELGQGKVNCYVGGIAKASGYYLSDAPYQIVGYSQTFSALIMQGAKLCNEIHILLEDGVNIDDMVDKISGIEQYSSMLVTPSNDTAYIDEKTDSLTAPVVLAGVAVLLLGVAIIFLLYSMSEGEKRVLISKLTVVGATKNQILQVFLIESALQAGIGTILGSLCAMGVFVALLKFTLSSTIAFTLSPLYLFLAGVIGFLSAMISSLMPIAKSMKGSIRENQLDIDKPKRSKYVLPVASLLLAIVCVIVGALVDAVAGIVSVAGMLFTLVALTLWSPIVLKGVAKLCGKINEPSIKTASVGIAREKRFARSSMLFTTGMTIAVILFMAWSLTTTIFTSYISEFENMVFVSNVRADTDESQFLSVDGVDNATSLVWSTADLEIVGEQKTINLLGSSNVLNLLDFEYITSKDIATERVNDGYILVDVALSKLYGVKEGDTLKMTYGEITQEVVVGGILKHDLFSGKYVVISQDVLEKLFSAKTDTVLVVAKDGYNVDDVVNGVRTKFAQNNYYVVDALEAFRWEVDSMDAVFDLIGALSIIVALFILGVSMSSAIIGRSTAQKERVALLTAGMSKNMLLRSEMAQYTLSAITAFVLAILSSLVLTLGLINALRLFDLYFDFMYEAWVTLTAGAVMSVCYALVPVAFAFKKGYNLKKV